MIQPLVKEIVYKDPNLYFAAFSESDGAVFLDSADFATDCGDTNRYSYILVNPFELFITDETKNPFACLKEKLKTFVLDTRNDLPPFQGGVAGYFSYDLCHDLYNISCEKPISTFPNIALGFYDSVISFDHKKQQAWIVSTGLQEADPKKRKLKAEEKQLALESKLATISASPNPDYLKEIIASDQITASITKETYCQLIKTVQQYIIDGDIFEANLSQSFTTNLENKLTPYQLYCKLRHLNPAPFSAFLKFGNDIIASASPERFLKINNNHVETRPIKGTRPRDACPQQDKRNAQELLNSKKDRAENTMIVDLMRNDLSKVCDDNSVVVTKLCGLESFQTVHHLVSVIRATLKQDAHAVDLLTAAFPGGSITGAPKIRAMQIIDELEPTNRGPYCGSIGYIGFDGCMDTSIIIRSFTIQNNRARYQAGGAIVYDSEPEQEYMETLHKANALTRALTEEILQ